MALLPADMLRSAWDTIREWYGFGRCAVKDAAAGSACVRIVTAASGIAVGGVRRRLAG